MINYRTIYRAVLKCRLRKLAQKKKYISHEDTMKEVDKSYAIAIAFAAY